MFKLILALLFILAGPACFKFGPESYKRWFRWGGVSSIILGLIIVVLSTFRVVPAGHVGVPVLFGKVKEPALTEGLNVINPLYNVEIMDCRIMKHEGQYDAASKDMQNVHVNMALNFRIIADKAPFIYQKIGRSYGPIVIDPAAQEVLKAVTALHNAGEILKTRPMIKQEVQERLDEWLKKYHVDLREVSLANISFDDAYENAILEKQVEEQNAQKKEYLLVQERIDADIAITKAKGVGDAAKARAQGDAEALRIKGKAEADYNKKVASSLTPILIQQQYLETWDGKLPRFMLGDKTLPLVQLPEEK
jgi:regulator of protease activity HflC (stomatin/prohibitin superfamily)